MKARARTPPKDLVMAASRASSAMTPSKSKGGRRAKRQPPVSPDAVPAS